VLEPKLLNKFDYVATFSEKDGGLLRGLGVRVPVLIEQLYFDLPREVAPLSGSVVVFVGAMYRPENDQAARWLVSDIWPRVREAVPDSELLIVGSGPSAKLRELAGREKGVTTVGFVKDLAAVSREASVVVAPLVVGAGVKLKVIEALASGVPVVATSVGAEGLPPYLFPGMPTTAEDVAGLIGELMRRPDYRRAIGAAGRTWAEGAHMRLGADVLAAVGRYRKAAASAERSRSC
jgi:glycosyltransferase involved in cell wall biosynthesis